MSPSATWREATGFRRCWCCFRSWAGQPVGEPVRRGWRRLHAAALLPVPLRTWLIGRMAGASALMGVNASLGMIGALLVLRPSGLVLAIPRISFLCSALLV